MILICEHCCRKFNIPEPVGSPFGQIHWDVCQICGTEKECWEIVPTDAALFDLLLTFIAHEQKVMRGS